jgi:hypothetical protein
VVASGITLGWGTASNISSIGDSIVATSGTLVEARNLGAAVNETVNGVAFTGQSTRDGLDTAFASTGLYVDGGISASFESIMDSFAYRAATGNATLTLTGLTSGQTYQLQLFVSDDRTTSSANLRQQRYTLDSYVSAFVTNGTSYALACAFIAGGSTQSVTVGWTAGNVVLNAFQVRQIS